MRENGVVIKLMDLENISIKMVPTMKVNGSTISKKEKEKKLGQMDPHSLDSIKMVKRMAKVSFCGQMEQGISEIG